MAPIALFAFAARQAEWLTGRQAILSQNIANASTPGYRAREARAFSETLARAPFMLAATQPLHIANSPPGAAALARPRPADGWETGVSGNNVNVEQELMAANEVNRGYGLNVGVVRAFQRMTLAGLRA